VNRYTIATSDLLIENEKMLRLFRKLGFTAKWLPGGTTRVGLQLK
jgi:hypothetical protein